MLKVKSYTFECPKVNWLYFLHFYFQHFTFMHSLYFLVDEPTFLFTLALFQVGKNFACFNHECLQVDRKLTASLGKKKCLLNPKNTYVFSPLMPLGNLGCTRNKWFYFYFFKRPAWGFHHPLGWPQLQCFGGV